MSAQSKPLNNPQRLLVVGPSWVGDMIMAQSLFIVLKRQYPQLCIDVLAPAWSAALLERMPEIQQSIDMPIGHGKLELGSRFHLGKQLAQNHYDWSILLPNSLKSALVPFFAGIKNRRGFVGEMRYGLLNRIEKLDKKRLTRTVQRFVALAYSGPQMYLEENIGMQNIPYPRLEIDKESALRLATGKFALFSQGHSRPPILTLCPGAEYGPAKQWPARYYAKIAENFLHQNLSMQGQVWLFGSEKDSHFCQQIVQECASPIQDLSGQTSLAEAIDLMSLSTAVISNDSGLMHVAAAVNVPTLGLYGSSDPNFTPPLSHQAEVVSLNLDCSPCFKRQCPLGHMDCLEKMTPEIIWDKLQILLKK